MMQKPSSASSAETPNVLQHEGKFYTLPKDQAIYFENYPNNASTRIDLGGHEPILYTAELFKTQESVPKGMSVDDVRVYL